MYRNTHATPVWVKRSWGGREYADFVRTLESIGSRKQWTRVPSTGLEGVTVVRSETNPFQCHNGVMYIPYISLGMQ
jgi:hypothetical protein